MTKETIRVYKDLMGANAEWAEKTRSLLAAKNVIMPNMIGSPGCGKTSLLESTIPKLGKELRVAVLEGDVETTNDAERLHALGIPVSQLLTSGACHLEAKLVHHALLDLPLDDLDIVVVENVGNLVCPAEFDIGEECKVAVLSVTEGEDKPAKYPLLFQEADAVVLTKIDLLPHLKFDLDSCLDFIRRVNPNIPVIQLSSSTGVGVDEWISYLKKRVDSQ